MALRKKQMGSTSSPDKKLPLNKSIPLADEYESEFVLRSAYIIRYYTNCSRYSKRYQT